MIRAVVRYDEVSGGRLAAAVTYYAFFATFALGLLAFATFGFVLDDPVVETRVRTYLAANLPGLDVAALREARRTAGVIAFIGLPITGWFWIDALRSAIRAMWHQPQYPGRFMVRLLVDLLVLVGLGALLAASLAVTVAATTVASRLAHATGTGSWLVPVLGLALGVGVNTLLAGAALTAVPRLRIPPRRLLGPALLVAAGLEVLKTLGQLYVQRVETNPTYRVVAAAVGLLVFLSVVNQLILFAAALTAINGVPSTSSPRKADQRT